MKMLEEIKTADRAEDWFEETTRRQGEDHGIRPSRLQKKASRVPIMREIARDLGNALGKETGSRLRELEK